MLTSLTIQNVVLIDRLQLEGGGGLLALTGETGAGKSILLDALGLALGARADSGLVRHGEDKATTTACFEMPARHPVNDLLREKGLVPAETLILRRTLGKDGRSKAFINDAPVGVQLLKDVGALLVEVHGQFETHGLLDPSTHLGVLDTYARIDAAPIRAAWKQWRAAKEKLDSALSDIEAARLQEDYLKYTVAELEKLDPKEGEDAVLAEKRQLLLNREKLSGNFEQATSLIEADDALQPMMGKLQIVLERLADKLPEVKPLLESLGRAQAEISDIGWQVERIRSQGEKSADRLEDIEERYFSLREMAKKHRTTVDGLVAVYADLSQKLRLITNQEEALAQLQKAATAARTVFLAEAEKASLKRKTAATRLAKAVNAELPDLKLDKAKITAVCDRSEDEAKWSPDGIDHVQFMISTNPNTPPGHLHKVASGGELSRFMLALKVILAETSSIPTLIFDEVDAGIGGATADAVGERLQRLAKDYQVLVVTHSPQVAARAAHHWHVAKSENKGTVLTRITPLKAVKERQEEIARMLSGAEITKEARAQAAKLLENHVAAA
ncbi:MAG TPA: DNA repair protein RecN [Patescibacteria group bacterium]|nr:DNA repair protein RecN [Patescibacteria group bacterium]